MTSPATGKRRSRSPPRKRLTTRRASPARRATVRGWSRRPSPSWTSPASKGHYRCATFASAETSPREKMRFWRVPTIFLPLFRCRFTVLASGFVLSISPNSGVRNSKLGFLSQKLGIAEKMMMVFLLSPCLVLRWGKWRRESKIEKNCKGIKKKKWGFWWMGVSCFFQKRHFFLPSCIWENLVVSWRDGLEVEATLFWV